VIGTFILAYTVMLAVLIANIKFDYDQERERRLVRKRFVFKRWKDRK
jgi:hypothetical protein